MEDKRPLVEASSLMSPEKRRQLAQWIRDGLSCPKIVESSSTFFQILPDTKKSLVCALGAALVGKHGGNIKSVQRKIDQTLVSFQTYITFSARLLRIPMSVVKKINELHCRNIPAKRIANMLEKGKFKV